MVTSNEKYPRLAGINYESMVDGEGVRATVFFSGCSHGCPGCHNKVAQDPSFGMICTDDIIEDIADNIVSRPFLAGLTLSGGDPLFCPQKTAAFLQRLDVAMRNRGKVFPDMWLYTGAVLPEVCNSEDPYMSVVLGYIGYLVDGEFVKAKADKTLAFRGSSNQQIWQHLGNIWVNMSDTFDKKGRS